MKKRGWGVRLGEISTLIYLLFPFLSIFDEKRGFQVVYISWKSIHWEPQTTYYC